MGSLYMGSLRIALTNLCWLILVLQFPAVWVCRADLPKLVANYPFTNYPVKVARTKGRICKRVVLANVALPRARVKVHPPRVFALLKGRITCGRCTFSPVSGQGERLPKAPLWKPPSCETPSMFSTPPPLLLACLLSKHHMLT